MGERGSTKSDDFLLWLCQSLEVGAPVVPCDYISHSFAEPCLPPLLFVSRPSTFKYPVPYLGAAVRFTFNLLHFSYYLISFTSLTPLFSVLRNSNLFGSEAMPYISTTFLHLSTFPFLLHLFWDMDQPCLQ